MRAHPWLSLGALALATLVVVSLLGGFRRADPPYPAVAVGEGVDLGRFTLTVTGARLLTTDPRDGDPLEDGKRLVAVDADVLNTDTESGVFARFLVEATFDGETELDPDLGTGDTGRYLQPEVTTPFLLTFEVPVGAEVADEVTLIMLRESYGWSNLVNFGPTWSGGVPFRSVTVPVAR